MNTQHGVTLVELIITIVIITVLSVSFAPKFLSLENENPQILQKELKSLLREIQLHSLNNATHCYSIKFSENYYHSVRYQRNVETGQCLYSSSLLSSEQPLSDNIQVWLTGNTNHPSNNNKRNFEISFDQLGRIQQCSNAKCIEISGKSTAYIYIESEGYIHAGY